LSEPSQLLFFEDVVVFFSLAELFLGALTAIIFRYHLGVGIEHCYR